MSRGIILRLDGPVGGDGCMCSRFLCGLNRIFMYFMFSWEIFTLYWCFKLFQLSVWNLSRFDGFDCLFRMSGRFLLCHDGSL